MKEHFLLVAMRQPFQPLMQARSLTPEEKAFHRTVRSKIKDDPGIDIEIILADAFILASDDEKLLRSKRNAYALHGYVLVGGDRQWYNNAQINMARTNMNIGWSSYAQ